MNFTDQHELFEKGQIGDWCFVNDFQDIWLCYPTPSGVPGEVLRDIIHLYIHKANESFTRTPNWVWDGNIEAPTITPSIRVNAGRSSEWHGFLTAGKVVTV
jgi:hypothetical protein